MPADPTRSFLAGVRHTDVATPVVGGTARSPADVGTPVVRGAGAAAAALCCTLGRSRWCSLCADKPEALHAIELLLKRRDVAAGARLKIAHDKQSNAPNQRAHVSAVQVVRSSW